MVDDLRVVPKVTSNVQKLSPSGPEKRLCGSVRFRIDGRISVLHLWNAVQRSVQYRGLNCVSRYYSHRGFNHYRSSFDGGDGETVPLIQSEYTNVE